MAGGVVGLLLVWGGLNPAPAAPSPYTGTHPAPFSLVPLSNWNVTARGATNATGGCSGPGIGLVEYCVLITILDGSPGFSTAGLGMHLFEPNGSNASFVNVTLIGLGPDVFATYTEANGWTPGSLTLPVQLNSTISFVLNAGRTPPTDYAFTAKFSSGYSCGFDLP